MAQNNIPFFLSKRVWSQMLSDTATGNYLLTKVMTVRSALGTMPNAPLKTHSDNNYYLDSCLHDKNICKQTTQSLL